MRHHLKTRGHAGGDIKDGGSTRPSLVSLFCWWKQRKAIRWVVMGMWVGECVLPPPWPPTSSREAGYRELLTKPDRMMSSLPSWYETLFQEFMNALIFQDRLDLTNTDMKARSETANLDFTLLSYLQLQNLRTIVRFLHTRIILFSRPHRVLWKAGCLRLIWFTDPFCSFPDWSFLPLAGPSRSRCTTGTGTAGNTSAICYLGLALCSTANPGFWKRRHPDL